MAASSDDSKDKLSRALGAAFLAHQVSELEQSVDKLSFSRERAAYDIQPRKRKQRDVRVVDPSALVHALPVLKRWIREDVYLLVVPLEAFSVLDILKKAPQPLHDLARDATRFLETQLNIAAQISADGSFTPSDKTPQDPRIRLRAQAKGEELPWSHIETLFHVPEDWTPPPPLIWETDTDAPPEPEPPTANDIPRSIRSTIQCILYFHSKYPSSNLIVHETSTPAPPSLSQHPQSQQQHREIDFPSLSSGSTISSHLTSSFSLEPQRILTSEILAAREWWKAAAKAQALQKEQQQLEASSSGSRAGRGGGRGTGASGRGRGRGGSRGGGMGGEDRGFKTRGGGAVSKERLFVP